MVIYWEQQLLKLFFTLNLILMFSYFLLVFYVRETNVIKIIFFNFVAFYERCVHFLYFDFNFTRICMFALDAQNLAAQKVTIKKKVHVTLIKLPHFKRKEYLKMVLLV